MLSGFEALAPPPMQSHKSHIYHSVKWYWRDEIQAGLTALLPGSSQNRGNTKIKCLNRAFGVTTATRRASVWLGTAFCKCLNRAGRLPWRSPAGSSVLSICWEVQGGKRQAFNRSPPRISRVERLQLLRDSTAARSAPASDLIWCLEDV